MTPPAPRPRSTAVALLVAGAFFMENLDGTVIATALPAMAKSFQSTPGAIAIGMTAYLLTLAIFIPASGWARGPLRVAARLRVAIALFTFASILCAFSTGVRSFTLARVLQGGAGALMVPVGRLVVLRGTAKSDLIKAIATLTWPGLVAPVIGPPVGGLITATLSWRWIFFINVPLGIVGLVLALRWIDASASQERRPFDLRGFLLNGASLAALLFALDRFGQPDAGVVSAASMLLASLALGALAIRHARRHAHPLVSLDALAVQTFRTTMIGGTLSRIAISTMPFLLPLLFQVGLGLDPFLAGLFVLWYGAANIGIKPLTTPDPAALRLSHRARCQRGHQRRHHRPLCPDRPGDTVPGRRPAPDAGGREPVDAIHRREHAGVRRRAISADQCGQHALQYDVSTRDRPGHRISSHLASHHASVVFRQQRTAGHSLFIWRS